MFIFLILLILTTFVIITIILNTHYLFVNEHQIRSDRISPKLTEQARRALSNRTKSSPINNNDVLKLAEKHTNIAITYMNEWNKVYSKVSDYWSSDREVICDVRPPNIEEIGFNNIYWQSIINTEDLTLYLYNAYLDERQTIHKVRVIGTSDHFNQLVNITLWCLLFFEGHRRSVLTNVTDIVELSYDFGNFYKRKGYYLPVLLTCDVPNVVDGLVPRAVAITTSDDCSDKLDNLLRVIYEPNEVEQNMIGVCVRALYYQNVDFSLRLLEWLELIKILGADKVFLYSFTTHPKMELIMDYYQSKGFVEWRHTTHPGLQLNDKYLGEMFIDRMGNKILPQETLELNDCLYRNLRKYKYLALLDIDEVIVPVNAHTWIDMLREIKLSVVNMSKAEAVASYVFTQSRVYSALETSAVDPNRLMYTMSHLHRTNFTGKAPKSLHMTNNIKVIWNHAPVRCITNNSDHQNCSLHWVKRQIGYLMHYRKGVDTPVNCADDEPKKCAIRDTILLKYRDQLETNMKIAINQIGFEFD